MRRSKPISRLPGPMKRVEDDDGHVFRRGEQVGVCEKTFRLLQREPYVDMFDPLDGKEALSSVASAVCCPNGDGDEKCC